MNQYTTFRTALRQVAAIVAATLLGSASAAVTEGRTAAGHRYLAGGIGVDEAEAMRAHASAYSLQVIVAAKSGAYLAGADLRIEGPGNAVLLDQPIGAPWLLVDLPPGRYTVRATYAGRTAEQAATIAPGESQRVVLHFDVEVDSARAPGSGVTGRAPAQPPGGPPPR